MKNGKETSSEEENPHQAQIDKPKEKKLINKKRKKEKDKEDKDKKEDKEDEKNKNEDIIVGENEVKFLLDDKKRVTVHKFKGQIKVDIREFYDDHGEMKPGKKGISLSIDNWNKLKEFVDEIEESINNMK